MGIISRLSRTLLEKNQLLDSNLDYGSFPDKVLQFGEGNFLRGFIDWMIHVLNKNQLFKGRIVAVQPTPHGKVVPVLHAQDGLYTIALRGIVNGEIIDKREVITSITRGINPYTEWQEVLEVAANPAIQVVFSNTTEAGLTYSKESYICDQSPVSFPAKLTACMHHRYQMLNGDPATGWIVIPCELIENNGSVLQDLVLTTAEDWGLSKEFKNWVIQHNVFCNTLVDRIVTGFPKQDIDAWYQELGYEDALLVVGEPYHLFVLDGNDAVRTLLPFHKTNLNVHWADISRFRELKVRILNGAHTLMCPVGLLKGLKTVQEVVNDPSMQSFLNKAIYDEILPTLPFPNEQKLAFASTVLERFRNPFNAHYLLDISLNSISKFKTRVLPTLLEYVERYRRVPQSITLSFTHLLYFYKGYRYEEGKLYGKHAELDYLISDSQEVLQFFYDVWNPQRPLDVNDLVVRVLGNQWLWGTNLKDIPGLLETVQEQLAQLLASEMIGMKSNGTY